MIYILFLILVVPVLVRNTPTIVRIHFLFSWYKKTILLNSVSADS